MGALFVFIVLQSHAIAFWDLDPVTLQDLMVLKKRHLEQSIRIYSRRGAELEKQLYTYEIKAESLDNRIKNAENEINYIPDELRKADKVVSRRIFAIQDEQRRLRTLIKEKIQTIKQMDQQVRSRYERIPLWWRISPEVNTIMRAAGQLPGSDISAPDNLTVKPLKSRQITLNDDKTTRSLQEAVKSSGIAGKVEIKNSHASPVITNRAPILFASGKTDVSRKDRKYIAELANIVKRYPATIRIEGFADKTKAKSGPSNWDIAARRALSVAEIFIKAGIPSKSIVTASMGEQSAASKMDSARQRRADIILMFK